MVLSFGYDERSRTDSEWLSLALERMQQRSRPLQSNFRVYAILTYEYDAADESGAKRSGWVSGTNSESVFIGGSLCAERSAAVQLRELGVEVKVTAVYLVSDMETCITPGVLCREYLLSICEPETPIHMSGCNGGEVRSATLGSLYPHWCMYTALRAEDAVASGSACRATGAVDASLRDFEFSDGKERERILSLHRAVLKATQEDAFESVHPIRYAAGVLFSDGTTETSWQRKALEYGNTLDAISSLVRIMEQKQRADDGVGVVAAIHVDQFGILHAPFAPARAQLSELGFADVDMFLHTPSSPHSCSLKVKRVKVADLVPDAPNMAEIFGCASCPSC